MSAARAKSKSTPSKAVGVKTRKSLRTAKAPALKKESPKPQLFCTCRSGDDGSPMVFCSECNDWYHFQCVNLTEEVANDINIYICPSCTERTGLSTAMIWEGPNALSEMQVAGPSTKHKNTRSSVEKTPPTKQIPMDEEISEDNDSEDEYVGDSPNLKASKRRVRAMSYTSESDAGSADENGPRRLRNKGSSPNARSSKRKARTSGQHPPPSKKQKGAAADAEEDPTRKHCRGKFEEIFLGIFMKYPLLDGEDKSTEELSDEQRTLVAENSKIFARELEANMFATFAEPDKNGDQHVAQKYKDRFRTLLFNLSQKDRVILHKRISSGQLSAQEISQMTSNELANEETKQSIKEAEKAALEHSILQRSAAPRAKITHKGLQDIEDTEGSMAEARERELETERRMAREREQRVSAALTQARQRAASTSIPPESPAVAEPPSTWGGPPPIPDSELPDKPPSFVHSQSDYGGPESELSLADLINLDDEPGASSTSTGDKPSPSVVVIPSELPKPRAETPTSPFASGTQATGSAAGPSPFAQPTSPASNQGRMFDLSSIWSSEQKEEEDAVPLFDVDASVHETEDAPMVDIEPELDGTEPHDQDFDMFLNDNDQEVSQPTEPSFATTSPVWTGKIHMPRDPDSALEPTLVARQMGGRSQEHDPRLWQTLFPTDLLHVEGRVPKDSSAQFLLQVRLNPTKELIGVAFSPSSEENKEQFDGLLNFLIGKGRHGLIFPWGNAPARHFPGRELYIIPLLAEESIPDYMELLDELKLPKTREDHYLIGIYVLTKGKLAPPPPLPPPVSLPIIAPGLTEKINELLAKPIPGAPPVDQSVLAAEVASLTPEQIQVMLKALEGKGLAHIPAPAPIPAPPVLPPPHMYTAYQPPPAPSALPMPMPHWPIQHSPEPPYGSRSPYEPTPDMARYNGDGPNVRGQRGGRGRSRGRGSRQGRDRDRDPPSHGPVDSGWPRKAPGNASPW